MSLEIFITNQRRKFEKFRFFHLVLFGSFITFIAVCFWIFSHSNVPKLLALDFRPSPLDVKSTLIRYNSSDKNSIKPWIDSLDKFLEVYRTPSPGVNLTVCDYNHPPGQGQVCTVNVEDWHPCVKNNQYGFRNSSPCVFINLRTINGWIPRFYSDPVSLPEEMPYSLKRHIGEEVPAFERKTVWVSCEGETPTDNENIGPIEYFPRQGFAGYYYPFKSIDGYLPPLVAVYFKQPQKRIIINVHCQVWAKNIKHSRRSLHFELLID